MVSPHLLDEDHLVTLLTDVVALILVHSPGRQVVPEQEAIAVTSHDNLSPAALHLALEAVGVERSPVRRYGLLHGVDCLVTGGTLGGSSPRHGVRRLQQTASHSPSC